MEYPALRTLLRNKYMQILVQLMKNGEIGLTKSGTVNLDYITLIENENSNNIEISLKKFIQLHNEFEELMKYYFNLINKMKTEQLLQKITQQFNR